MKTEHDTGDCQGLRETVEGLHRCCTLCHAQRTLQGVDIRGERLSLCCNLVTDIMARRPEMGMFVFDQEPARS